MAAKETGPQLTQDQTEMIVLSVLSEGPSYGYAISKQIAARSEDTFRVGASQLYPLLTKLRGSSRRTGRRSSPPAPSPMRRGASASGTASRPRANAASSRASRPISASPRS